MITVAPLKAEDIDQICRIDAAEVPSQLQSLMAKPAFAGLGIATSTGLVGFIYGWVVENQGEIMQITIAQDSRRQGYGQALLTSFLAEFDLKTCWLELRADNDAAFSLYRRIGFVEDGQRKGYYQSARNELPPTSAILMQWSLDGLAENEQQHHDGGVKDDKKTAY